MQPQEAQAWGGGGEGEYPGFFLRPVLHAVANTSEVNPADSRPRGDPGKHSLQESVPLWYKTGEGSGKDWI